MNCPRRSPPFRWTCEAEAGTGAACGEPAGVGSLNQLVSLPAGTEVTFTFTGIAPPECGGPLIQHGDCHPSARRDRSGHGQQQFDHEPERRQSADLRITKASTPNPYVAGAPLTTTIVVHNDGPDAVTGARVLDEPPPGLGPVTWDCTVTAGKCGIASGSGQIDTLVDLPAVPRRRSSSARPRPRRSAWCC